MPEMLPITALRPTLHVCTTCRAGREPIAGEAVAGQVLFNRLEGLLSADDSVRLRPVACLASCARGCSATISMPGKWTYLLGGLNADIAPDLLTYGAAYAASKTGTLMPSRRPASLADAVVARFPAQDTEQAA